MRKVLVVELRQNLCPCHSAHWYPQNWVSCSSNYGKFTWPWRSFVNIHMRHKYSHMLDHYPKPFITYLPNHLFPSSRSFSQTIRHICKLTYLIILPSVFPSHSFLISITSILFSLPSHSCRSVSSFIWLYHRRNSQEHDDTPYRFNTTPLITLWPVNNQFQNSILRRCSNLGLLLVPTVSAWVFQKAEPMVKWNYTIPIPLRN